MDINVATLVDTDSISIVLSNKVVDDIDVVRWINENTIFSIEANQIVLILSDTKV